MGPASRPYRLQSRSGEPRPIHKLAQWHDLELREDLRRPLVAPRIGILRARAAGIEFIRSLTWIGALLCSDRCRRGPKTQGTEGNGFASADKNTVNHHVLTVAPGFQSEIRLL